MNNESLRNMSVMDMLNNPVLTTRLLTEMKGALHCYEYEGLEEATAEFEEKLWALKATIDSLDDAVIPMKNIWCAVEKLDWLVAREGENAIANIQAYKGGVKP